MKHSVHANGRAVCTKGTGDIARSDAPDVCLTPDNKPIPVVNETDSTQLGTGKTARTFIEGDEVWTQHGKLDAQPSNPAHEGTAGGTNSTTYRDKAWATDGSKDVIIEGAGVTRVEDPTAHNDDNTTGQVLPGEPPPKRMLCIMTDVAQGEDRGTVTRVVNLKTTSFTTEVPVPGPGLGHGHATLAVFEGDQVVEAWGLYADGNPFLSDGESDLLPDHDFEDGKRVIRPKYRYSHCVELTADQYEKFTKAVARGGEWTPWTNCASWAVETFFDVTGVEIDADEFLHLETPREIGQHIIEANGGLNSNYWGDGIPAGERD